MRALTVGRSLPASLASAPSRCGRNDSSCSRSRRVSTGASPLLPTATIDRRAIDDRGHDEARQLAIVDDVHRHVAALGLTRDPRVDRMLVGGRDRQAHAVEMLGPELVGDDARSRLLAARSARPRTSSGATTVTCAERSQQQIDLARGDFAAADDEHGLAGETQEDGEVVHGGRRQRWPRRPRGAARP